jgi:hypothetical protein
MPRRRGPVDMRPFTCWKRAGDRALRLDLIQRLRILAIRSPDRGPTLSEVSAYFGTRWQSLAAHFCGRRRHHGIALQASNGWARWARLAGVPRNPRGWPRHRPSPYRGTMRQTPYNGGAQRQHDEIVERVQLQVARLDREVAADRAMVEAHIAQLRRRCVCGGIITPDVAHTCGYREDSDRELA